MKTILAIIIFISLVSVEYAAQASKYNPILGPNRITLPSGNATMLLPEGYAYLGKAEATLLLKEIGNPNADVDGLLAPAEENPDWFIYLKFNPIGYFKMEEVQEDLKGLDLLAEIKKRTESENQTRMSLGALPISVVGYAEPLALNTAQQTLDFAIESTQGPAAMVERRTMFFSRKGYLLGSFVTPKEKYASVKKSADEVFSTLAFVGSHRYTDFNADVDSYSSVGISTILTGREMARKSGGDSTLLGIGKFVWALLVAVAIPALLLVRRFFLNR